MNIALLANLLAVPDLATHIDKVELAMRRQPTGISVSLSQPAGRIIGTKGKRLRPALVIAVAATNGRDIDDQVVAAAAAIELIHIASLVHDDIIDVSDERWGTPTINAKEGIDKAILVGDYLVSLASIQAAKAGGDVAQVVAEAFASMCDGQSIELADTYNTSRTIDSYLECINKKTAALIAAAVEVGGICAGVSKGQLQALRAYGQAFGVAFQLTDDLLDLLSTSDKLGKPTGNDIKEGVYTLPLLLGLQGPKRVDLLARLSKRKTSVQSIAQDLQTDGSIEATIKQIHDYNRVAAKSLKEFGNDSNLSNLAKLPDSYTKWALQL